MPTVNTEEIPTSLSDTITLSFPTPGQPLREDGRRLDLVQFTITSKTTRADLKAELSKYGLPVSGNKTILISRLREFAKNSDDWSGLFRAKVKRKRGDISASRSNTHSAKRIIEKFGAREQVVEYQPKKSGGERRAPRSLPVGTIVSNSAWAAGVLQAERVGDKTSGSVLDPDPSGMAITIENLGIVHPAASQASVNPDALTTQPQLPNQAIPNRRFEREVTRFMKGLGRTVNERFDRLDSRINMFELSHAGPLAVTSRPNILQVTSPGQPSGFPLPTAQPPALLPDPPPVPREAIPRQNLMVLDIGGQELTFDKTKVPNPPPINFSDNLSQLFAEWHVSDLLKVNGHGIPVKHWECFYKKRMGIKSGAWSILRVKWGNWKFLVEERERFHSEEDFWAAYSNKEDGSRLLYQQILDRLQGGRGEDDDRDAANALKYFGGDLTRPDARSAFSYKKRGVHSVCSKNQAIAKKWWQLLQEDPGIAEGWRVMQEEGSSVVAGAFDSVATRD
ncbi:hypothetical protein A0H81_08474 [Grifola frondosa]|uniref:SAP domain-containing protein n=1 Tax=Grifola frondosa TaxID=5627 RepID=A0A1C7M307_GRIFR|nr:hypothetical protein A0H81_08474 [Grifola frondosa]